MFIASSSWHRCSFTGQNYTNTTDRNTETLLTSIKEAGQKVKKMLRKYMFTYQ